MRSGPRQAGRTLALAALAVLASLGATARAQDSGGTIFDHFRTREVRPPDWQIMPEYPVYLRPQTMPDAEVVKNTGVNLIVSFRPRNRIYFSRGYHFAQMAWKPEDSNIKRVEVNTFDINEYLNFSLERVSVIAVGLGLGVMDGLVEFHDRKFITRLEPFVPVQFGLGLYPADDVMVGLKFSHYFFLGPGPVLSVSRGLLGIGFNF